MSYYYTQLGFNYEQFIIINPVKSCKLSDCNSCPQRMVFLYHVMDELMGPTHPHKHELNFTNTIVSVNEVPFQALNFR